jgi:enoyl-CoA hydratase/carnithine racemase
MYREIQYEVTEPVATVTLNRPERLNAWTERMGQEIRHAVAQAENDARAVAIVLTGAGRGFCAGADMGALGALTRGETMGSSSDADLSAAPGDPEMGPAFRGPYSYFLSVRKPLIAAVNGPCAGLGLVIALFCDLRFAAESAVFTTSFSRRGLIAEWGISWTLPRLVGPAHALDLLFSGRKVAASEAERIGLVNRVLPDAELLAAARAYVDEMAAHASPTSMQIMKREVYEHLTQPLDRAEADALRLTLESFQRPDFAEGVQSFLEKRPPRFARIGTR